MAILGLVDSNYHRSTHNLPTHTRRARSRFGTGSLHRTRVEPSRRG
jgi:hypothetical protein